MKSLFIPLFLLVIGAGPAPGWSASTAPTDHFFTASDGVTLHYLEAGQGPALLFIPGWTMPADIWEKQINHFSARYHVVALDPRCQGQSEKTTQGLTVLRRAQDIQELTNQIKAPRVLLVGWSMGGSEVLAYLKLYGALNLAGVVLVDGSPGAEPSPALLRKRENFIRKFEANRNQQTDDFVRWMYHKPQSEAYLRKIVQSALKTPTGSAVLLLQDMYADARWSPDYSTIQLPVLYFSSDVDTARGQWLKSKIKNMRLEQMKGAGHALFVDEPELFNDKLQAFMNQIGFSDHASN